MRGRSLVCNYGSYNELIVDYDETENELLHSLTWQYKEINH